MNLSPWALLYCLIALLGFFPTVFGAQEKQIRLRNETITTSAIPKLALTRQALAEEPLVSGLYLIQFTDAFQEAWRPQLKAQNVELLRFVPDDAFIARVSGVRLGQIRALPFVYWVGEYKESLKIHSALSALQDSNQTILLRIMLAPNAAPSEVDQVQRMLDEPVHQSKTRFGIILSGRIKTGQLGELAKSEAVLWIERAPQMKLFDEVSSKIVAGGKVQQTNVDGGLAGGSTNGHATATQQLGFDGRGVAVAVVDSGLNDGTIENMHPDLKGRVDAFFYYGNLKNAADEHGHGTHVAGIVAGDGATGEADPNGALYGLGVAPKSHLVVQRIFDALGNFELPSDFGTLTRDAVGAGAIIGSNSWGDETQGRYDSNAAEFDALVRDADDQAPGDQPFLIQFSAGNDGLAGAQTIGSPAVAKNVITTGASQNNRFGFVTYTDGQEAMADFSSRGPCEDGRIKPDVVAPGTWIASLQSISADIQNAWAPISPNYQYQGGTSQAGPHVSGAAAVFVQYYRETHAGATPSPALIKAALINSAVDMDDKFGTDPVPNGDEGWGRIDLTKIIGASRSYDYADQTTLLTTGQTYEKKVLVASAEMPLKITMVYTDVPGLPAAIPALVNDLDLEVIGPDGAVYHGNQFDKGESIAGAPAFDAVNNVEGVQIANPIPGEYIVRVRAAKVVEDARQDTPDTDQDFALVVSGKIPPPGQAVLLLDRTAYTAPGGINLKLIDFDLAGQPSASVLLTSTTETNGEAVVLQPFGSAGVFTGLVATVTGPALADGQLQISQGDTVQAQYQDNNALRVVQVRVDLTPPLITHIATTNELGRVLISWDTDEPAAGMVRYGTNSVLSFSASESGFQTHHEVGVQDNLISGAVYQFSVSSTDEAGNISTDDNQGRFYTFTAKLAKVALLVNAYTPDSPDYKTPEIPVTAYTDALDRTGISYDVWNVKERGSPGVNDLRPFRVVIWRLNDSIVSLDTLSIEQQSTLTQYVDGGGGFFLSSMEVLTRLEQVGVFNAFRANTLHVQNFDEDEGVPTAEGVDGESITSGMQLDLDYSPYDSDTAHSISDLAPDFSDRITVSTNAAPIFLEPQSGQAVGMRYPRTGVDSPGRVVFLPFPLDTVPLDAPDPNNRVRLLRNVLSFLAPGVNGLGTIALDSSIYTVPSLVTLEVADSDLAGQGHATAKIVSDTDTAGQTVALTETVQRGLFRGTITLVPATNASVAGQLRAANGDTIRVEYDDASAQAPVSASASIDTEPVTMSSLLVTPSFQEATATWDTSEPADALVQFGESALLGRTAYQPDQAISHAVRMTGLAANRVYYYQVVSRDAAGNITIDDNNGQLYTFHTLAPIAPPWTDHFEIPSTNWVVSNGVISQDVDPSEVTWQLGSPNNGKETVAHSPVQAWGSNLNGEAIDTANTDLISPPIDLSGGNRASVGFWHSYDFTPRSGLLDDERGGVYISTNNGVAWSLLKEYSGDLTVGWQEETIDLSAYVGQVVRVGWNYQLISDDTIERPGWLIDDVSFNVTNVVVGRVQITNNLSQAAFTISGPVTRTGSGLSATFTNLPVGQYTVAFQDVPYYFTPLPQTNVLKIDGTVFFQGNYTFPDANNNKISDLWEQQVFGEVSQLRTFATDTDHDGATDYDEFVAGTDPNSEVSTLAIKGLASIPGGAMQLTWQSRPGRVYQVMTSNDAQTWRPFSKMIPATGEETSFVLPSLLPSLPYFFQVQVRP